MALRDKKAVKIGLTIFLGLSLIGSFAVYYLCFYLDSIYLLSLEFAVGILLLLTYYSFSKHICFKGDGGCPIFLIIILIELGILVSVYFKSFIIGIQLEILQGFTFLFLLNNFRKKK